LLDFSVTHLLLKNKETNSAVDRSAVFTRSKFLPLNTLNE